MLVKVYPNYIYNKNTKKKKITKTKQLSIENWKKFLDRGYYNKHFSELSKSQQRKVKQYLKDSKKY